MPTYFMCFFFCYLIYLTNADDIPRSGIFYQAPSIVERTFRGDDKDIELIEKNNFRVRSMRTWWFKHGIKLIRQMTHEVFLDVDTKYSQAIYTQNKYKHAITFQLGTTAANIMDYFEEMLITYRRYANMSTFKTARQLKVLYDLQSFNEAFISIQGLYNQIRVDEYIFNNAVERLLKKYERIRRLREKRSAKRPKLRNGEAQRNILRTREAQRNILQTREAQQNILQTREAQQNILQTREAQQNILRTRDNQQNSDRDEQDWKISDATNSARQNNARSRSTKKPLWVYKEAIEDNNY